MTARDWRGFSEEQWGRLGGAVRSWPQAEGRRTTGGGEALRFALSAAPILGLAAFLLSASDAGRFGRRAHEVEEYQMNRILGAMVIGATLVAVDANADELVRNGSFEQSNYPGGNSTPFCGGSVSVPDWEVFRIDDIFFNPDFPKERPIDGDRVIDLNQCAPGWIRQSLTTTPGERYSLSFYMGSINASCQLATRSVRVTCGPIDVTLEFEPGSGFTPFRYDFTASAPMTELKFEGLNSGCESARLDAVSVRPLVCPGDLDASDSVTGVDLAIVLTNWNAPNPKYPEADVNGDGAVDGADLAIVLSNWGPCP
jgi:hypothetical protein